MKNEEAYFDNKRGISVTRNTLKTRYKDEALSTDQSVLVGREPLWFGIISGFGLIAFCYQFGDLLYLHEQITIALIGAAILVLGYSIAALRIGQFMREKTVFWHNIWTVQAVRRAIEKARNDLEKSQSSKFVDTGE